MTPRETLLLGPGPSNVHPRVLQAMAQPIVGHLDPAFLRVADEVQERLRQLFGTANRLTLPLAATGSGGMEACFTNLVQAGDRVVVGVAGVFGERMCDVATRLGGVVTRVDTDWGTPLDESAFESAIRRTKPSVVAFVHAETSTGVCQPPRNIARTANECGAHVIVDCVTSLGGLPLSLDEWGIDAAYSGTQKCLSCPPGLSPASFSERVLERVAARRAAVPSWYFDLSLLSGYYGQAQGRVYHHTAPISAIYGLAEALRLVQEEGMETRAARHREAAARLIAGVERFGFRPLVPEAFRLPMLTTLLVPDALQKRGEAALRQRLLESHGIEVGGGLGKLAGSIWRVGLMGENARPEAVDRLLAALAHEIAR